MQYREAFKALGYDLPNPRQDWSAEKPDGICITLWRVQVDWTPPPPGFDLWSWHIPGEGEWERKPGHAKRMGHLRRAMDEFDGWVDTIIISGTPGGAYESACPWLIEKRRNHCWRITKFDEASGFFAAVATELKSS